MPYPYPVQGLKGENFASEPREPSEGGECTKEVHDPTEVRLPPANSITKFSPLRAERRLADTKTTITIIP